MQAINHVATALVLKRAVPSAPLAGLLVATEAVEFLWVGLNLVGIERTRISDGATSVADIHLEHMPWSHSIVMSLAFAAIVGLVVLWRGKTGAVMIAAAFSAAVLSHIVLDLLTHARDIPIAPLIEGTKYGSGLMGSAPLLTLGLETLWGILCWRIYGGSRALLAVILAFALVALPSYMPSAGATASLTADAFPLLIGFQMVVTIVLVWIFARRGGRPSI